MPRHNVLKAGIASTEATCDMTISTTCYILWDEAGSGSQNAEKQRHCDCFRKIITVSTDIKPGSLLCLHPLAQLKCEPSQKVYTKKRLQVSVPIRNKCSFLITFRFYKTLELWVSAGLSSTFIMAKRGNILNQQLQFLLQKIIDFLLLLGTLEAAFVLLEQILTAAEEIPSTSGSAIDLFEAASRFIDRLPL